MTRRTPPPWQTANHLPLAWVRLHACQIEQQKYSDDQLNKFHVTNLSGDEEVPAVTSLRCSAVTVCKAELHHNHHLEQNDTLARAASL